MSNSPTDAQTPHAAPYPLVFQPMLYEKVWGGDRLGKLGKPVKPGAKVGESWEVADMGATSASGAGGGAARSIIANGALAGRTLHDAVRAWKRDLLGEDAAHRCAEESHGFPLLVKFLDARENLSVQVHPSPSYASANAACHLKTECWYILRAEPGSVIYKGVKTGVTRDAFERALSTGAGEGVVEMLEAVAAVPGECHNLPSGTVHALGAGVLVAEVQTPSDTTFRVFDWGRVGRELHVKQAMACIDFGPAPAARSLGKDERETRLVETEFFTLDEHRLAAGATLSLAERRGCGALILLSGAGAINFGDAFTPWNMGMTMLVPAACNGATTIEAGPTGLRFLRASVV